MNLRVAKLEGLLARVQARAAEPRPPSAQAAPAPEATDELDQPTHIGGMDELDEVQDIEDIDEVEFDEPGAPESGPVSATTLGDAIDAAEHQPPLTPPPESGEEMTSPHIPADSGPTMEQLGETISLDEGQTREFELDEPTLDEPTAPPEPADMEAQIPRSAPHHAELQAPEGAREELERVRLGDSTPIEARVSSRPVISTNVVDLVTSSREFSPQSFLDLVDASLALK